MEYVKLTAFTDSMVDTLNDQYAIIEDMQARFPELVNDDVIAEIRRLVDAGEFDDILQAEADRFLEEKTAQIAANTEAIQAEVARATGEETANSEAIQAEVARATGAETANSEAIQAEVARATGAETAITNIIDEKKHYERGVKMLDEARTNSWSHYPLILNEEYYEPVEEFSENPVLLVNYATGEINVNGVFRPKATGAGSGKYIYACLTGPNETDTLGFRDATKVLRTALHTTNTNNDPVIRNLKFGASRIWADYNLYEGKAAYMSCQRPLLTETGATNERQLSIGFAPATQTICQEAAAWCVRHEGEFEYNQNDAVRLGVRDLESGNKATDCSGLLFRAFKAQGHKIPSTSGSIMTAQGKLITWADTGVDVDVSKLKIGDIFGIGITTDPESNFHFNHVGIVTAVDYANNNFTLTHQPGSATATNKGPFSVNGQTTYNDRPRLFIRLWNDPDLNN